MAKVQQSLQLAGGSASFVNKLQNINITRIFTENGSLILPALITLIMVSYFAMSMMSVKSTSDTQQSNYLSKLRAQYAAIAGLELAKYRLNNGRSPDTEEPLGLEQSSFTITSNPEEDTIDVDGNADIALHHYTMESQFSSDCIEITGNSFSWDTTWGGITDLTLRKTCLDRITILSMRISWDGAVAQQTVHKVFFDSTTSPIYSAMGEPTASEPRGGAASGDVITPLVTDIYDTATHSFNLIQLDYPDATLQPPAGTEFTVELFFNDGSSTIFRTTS